MKEQFSPAALSGLIGSIYDCALAPSQWESVLTDIGRAFESDKAILSLNDVRHDNVLISKSIGWEPMWLEERAKHLPEIHTRLTEWMARQSSEDIPFVASREIPRSQFQTSPYVRACLMPLGIADIVHFFLIKTTTHFSELVLCTHGPQGVIKDWQIDLGALLLPHLRRAVTISNVLDVCTFERQRMTELLDSLQCAVILADENSVILHANRAAETMLANDNFLHVRQGVIKAKLASANKELRMAIMIATKDEADIGRNGIAIRLTDAAATSVFAHVLPLTGSDLRTSLHPKAVAAIFVGGSAIDECDITAFASAFCLTPAETRVVAGLMMGQTLAEVAGKWGVARSTVKTHMDNIFSKTGVTRQSNLIRLVTQTLPPV